MRRITSHSPLAAAALVRRRGVRRRRPPGAGQRRRPTSHRPSLVTTTGHGVVTAVPDEAAVSAGVHTHAATAAAALAQNAQLMQQVIAALKSAGGSDLQTQQVSLYPQTDDQGNVTGYAAQNTGQRQGQDRRVQAR